MDADVVIVGMGTAGSAAAAALSKEGLSVIGVDASPLDQAGARWVNGVPDWVFPAAGLPAPVSPVKIADSAPFHFIVGRTQTRLKLSSVLELDMRHLTAHLQQVAVGNDAKLHGEVRVTGLSGDTLHTTAGDLTARWFVDASGMSGARLAGQPTHHRGEVCVAAQQVHEIANPDGATAWLSAHQAEPGDVVCFTGVEGGYSILNVRADGDRVGLLTGSIPGLGHASGVSMLNAFVRDQPWIGERRFGGARSIPLCRPWVHVGDGNVALIGDAACQVYAPHGSGIAQQLLAARVLADALVQGAGPNGYNSRWQQTYGGSLAAADLFRRFSSTLSVPRLGHIVRSGILNPGVMADAMSQRAPSPTVGALTTSLMGLARSPRIAGSLLPTVARMRMIQRHYRRYPDQLSHRLRWARRLETLSSVALHPREMQGLTRSS